MKIFFFFSIKLLKVLDPLDLERLNTLLKCLIPESVGLCGDNSSNWSEQIDTWLLVIVIDIGSESKDEILDEEFTDSSLSVSLSTSLSVTPPNSGSTSSSISLSSVPNTSSLFCSLQTPAMYYRRLNDPEWTTLQLSETCFTLLGYPREYLIQNWKVSYWNLIVASDKERVWNEIQEAIKNHKSFTLVYSVMTVTGAIKQVWERGIPVLSDGGIVLEGIITEYENHQAINDELKEKRKQLVAKSFHNLQYFQSIFLSLQDVLSRYQSFIYDMKVIGKKGIKKK